MTQSKLEWTLNGLNMSKSFSLNSQMLDFANWLLSTAGDVDVVVKQWLTVNICGIDTQGDKFRHDFIKLSEL